MSPKEQTNNLKRFEDFPASLRREYFTTSALLRFFVLWEDERNVDFFRELSKDFCSLQDLLSTSHSQKCPFCSIQPNKNNHVVRSKSGTLRRYLSDWTLAQSRNGPYMAYFIELPSHSSCICRFIPKLIATCLKPSYFDANTYCLTKVGKAKVKELRDKWQHQIRMPLVSLERYTDESDGMAIYYYATTKHLKFLLQHQMEEIIRAKAKEVADQLNATINDAFKDITLDEVPINDPEFNSAIGVASDPVEDYQISSRVLEILRSQLDERRLTHLILALQSSVEENLVSSNYLDRISGLIQSKRSTD